MWPFIGDIVYIPPQITLYHHGREINYAEPAPARVVAYDARQDRYTVELQTCDQFDGVQVAISTGALFLD